MTKCEKNKVKLNQHFLVTLCARAKAIDNHNSWPIENFVMMETLQKYEHARIMPKDKGH
jgi:hypothetical protein